MCLYKNHFLPKISFKPIEVYKILSKSNASKSGYETPFLCTEVFFNTTIKATKHWKTSLFKKSIHGEGVHAYRDLTTAVIKASHDNRFFFIQYYYVVVKAIIPRFTIYWIGNNGDIAASKLYITDEFIQK